MPKKSPNTNILHLSLHSSGKSSGLLVLFFAKLGEKEKNETNLFDERLHSKIKCCKSNIFVKGKSNHFDSSGYYYSFGNRASYKKIGNSSIDTYANKKVALK